MNQPKLNLGILAHVDAGKTTLTEQLLYTAGAIRTAGSVDKGTSATDSLPVEQERGISVRLATAVLQWRLCRINLIDTPGHVDFCAEVERSLRALDAAILVVCAVGGVQAFTITLYQALASLGIPTLIFINKLDRAGADVAAVLDEIRRELSPQIIALQTPVDQGTPQARPPMTWAEGRTLDETALDAVLETDDALLARFFEGETPPFSDLDEALARASRRRELTPVLMGVAKNGVGVEALLDAAVRYLPFSQGRDQDPFSALVFKIEHHQSLGKTAYLRLFQGTLKARDKLHNATRDTAEKAGQLKRVEKGAYVDEKAVSAGDIVVVSGLAAAQVGDVYGDASHIPQPYTLSTPLLTVQAQPEDTSRFPDLVHALQELAEEDPLLAVVWLPQQREIHLQIAGTIQLEVLASLLAARFGLAARFNEPTIIYKETPTKAGTGFERYWMPKPCWAVLKLQIEPGPPGSGVAFQSNVSVDHIALRYQNEIQNTLPKALAQGIKGWQVTDLKITLIEGEDHNVHTRPGDFITATPMALMQALTETGTTLLEPILRFTLSAPSPLLGVVTSDIAKMRGSFGAPELNGDRFTLQGKLPAATSLEYPIQLASRSGGKGKIATRLDGYEPCSDDQGQTTPYRGVSPLDRDKWILQARGALNR